ncbi:MAG: ATP-binding protein [Lachnospiraceae bacterium]|nr:ATP-binding protein [Lachnospiraceae bacterium]
MNVMIAIHGTGFILCLILAFAVFMVKPSESQKYLFEGTVFISINVFGYLCELLSTTENAMQMAVKLQYLGTTFGLLGFLFFICLYNSRINKRILKFIKIFFCIADMVVLSVVLCFEKHNLFYTKIERLPMGEHCLWIFTPGPVRILWSGAVWILGFTIIWISIASALEHKGEKRTEYKIIILATCIPTAFMVVQSIGITRHFDIFPLSMMIAETLLVVTMFRYRLFDTVTVAKDRVLEELREGIFVTDIYGKILYFNPEFQEVFPRVRWYADSNFYKNKPVYEDIIRFIETHPDGFFMENHYYKWQKVDILDSSEQINGILYRIFDMTENYQYTRKLIELKEEAERANEAKSSFLASMSHEIRTPINAVLGMNEMILRECQSDNIREYAGNIQNAGKTLLSIINDILDLSKIESGKMEIVEADYDMRRLLEDIENMISMRAEEKNLKFCIEADADIPTILHGDEMRIKQCIINLLTNSVKYTKKGSILLKIEKVNSEANMVNLFISVTDTGIGIKESELPKLFDSFSRLDVNKNRNIEGTGLGLNITKNLVDMMGGNLMVESVYGEGSTFSFAIPQKIVDEKGIGNYKEELKNLKENQMGKEHSYIAPTASILSVDDNKVNIAVVKGLLKKLKIQCDSALSGMECLEKVAQNHYDVILLDYMMPEMDGIETLRRMQEMESYQKDKPTVIALTANALAGAKDEYIQAGFTDYLSKPIDSVKLETLLRKYLPEEKIEEVE